MPATLTYYQKARRYIDKAEDSLKKSRRDGNYYTDLRYVKYAGKTAYEGVELAARWLIELNNIKLPANTDNNDIKKALSKINTDAVYMFHDLYSYLYIVVCESKGNNVKCITESMKTAKKFVALLKEYDMMEFIHGFYKKYPKTTILLARE
jgi:hypothetical protein